jgi:F-type H+-transporting ATPase subunit c
MLGKLIGAGLATIAVGGGGIGLGIIFAGLMVAVSRNPGMESTLFTYAIMGFALTEATSLLGLMMAFIILFS